MLKDPNWRALSYVFGVGCCIIGLILYNKNLSEGRLLVASILITAGIVALLASYMK